MSFADATEQPGISSADARSQVRSVLMEVCCGLPLPEARRLRDDALLVVSELIANALQHAGGVTRFSIRLNSDELQFRVSDSSGDRPRSPANEAGQPGCYGWAMARRLCSRLQVTTDAWGKTVTAALSLPLAAQL